MAGLGDFAAKRCKYMFIYSHDKTRAREFCVMSPQIRTTAFDWKKAGGALGFCV
jgi:hypothetical protein